jgi:hypothetical protein
MAAVVRRFVPEFELARTGVEGDHRAQERGSARRATSPTVSPLTHRVDCLPPRARHVG